MNAQISGPKKKIAARIRIVSRHARGRSRWRGGAPAPPSRMTSTALSWAALNRVPGIAVPEFAKQELQKRSDACRMKAMQHCLLLAEVLRRFNRAAILVMPLKGQILSLKLYGDVGLRETLDLDLEVAREDLGKAQACLESADWHPDSTFSPMTPRQRDSFLKNEHSMTFLHARTDRMLELHWRNQWETPGATAARWARGVSSAWQGYSIQAMSPGDLALYLSGHGGSIFGFAPSGSEIWRVPTLRDYWIGRRLGMKLINQASRACFRWV